MAARIKYNKKKLGNCLIINNPSAYKLSNVNGNNFSLLNSYNNFDIGGFKILMIF